MRFWISWSSPSANPRKRGPRFKSAVWISGSGGFTRQESYSNYCAVVDAPSEEAAWETVEKTYRILGRRFCEEKPDDWSPGGRFQA